MYIKTNIVNIINGDCMEKKDYKRIVDRHSASSNRIGNSVIAFLVGGTLGTLGCLLTDVYSYYLDIPSKEASTLMIVTLIFFACLFTSLGFFDKWVNFARCGLIIPITGFAHSIMSAGLEFKREGFVYGIGSNVFKLAGSVLFYGISVACLVGIIRYIGGF